MTTSSVGSPTLTAMLFDRIVSYITGGWIRGPILQQSSPLLALSAELRTTIWLYLMPGRVRLTKEQPLPRVPAIVFAARQTLKEILPIFYGNTRFSHEIFDSDGAFACESEKTICARARKVSQSLLISYRLNTKPNWSNLLAWAKAVHAEGWSEWAVLLGTGLCEEADVVFSTLTVAARLSKMPWEEARAVLELLPAARDPRWQQV